MKKILTLTNEQAQALYVILKKPKLTGTENRHRWRFIEVLHPKVEEFEAKMTDIQTDQKIILSDNELSQKDRITRVRALNEDAKKLQKETQTYEFTNKDDFVRAKGTFDAAGVDLDGDLSRNYYELEEAFLNVQDVEEPTE